MSVQSGAADVFLSYARDDVAVAEQLARVLGHRGWAVWWDRDLIAGLEFDRMIEEQLHAARAVIVLWSDASLKSRWVRSEASAAADRGVLLPVMIADVTSPMEFRNIQAVMLRGWKGQADHPGIEGLDRALRILAGEPRGRGEGPLPPPLGLRPEQSQPSGRWRWAAISGAASVVVLAIIGAVLLAGGDEKEQAASTEPPAETTVAAETAALATTAVAAEITAPATTAVAAEITAPATTAVVAGSEPVAGCFGASVTPAIVTFVNNGTETVQLWYRDEECVDRLWTPVPAASSSREDAFFVGDYWRVVQPDSGEVLKEGYVTEAPSVIVIPSSDNCPAASDQATSLTVTNNRSEAVGVYLVLPDCTEELHLTLQPGDSGELPTYETQTWSVRLVDDATEQLQQYVVTAGQDLLEIA